MRNQGRFHKITQTLFKNKKAPGDRGSLYDFLFAHIRFTLRLTNSVKSAPVNNPCDNNARSNAWRAN